VITISVELLTSVALAPFYVCGVAAAVAVTAAICKGVVALFGNAQELQDRESAKDG